MIEFGWVGVIFFGHVLVTTLKTVYHTLKELHGTPVSTVALASAACIVMAIASFPSGSPFLGIPMGALVWFFLGTLMKLAEQHEAGKLTVVESTATPAPVTAKRFLYHRPKGPVRAQGRSVS